MLYPLRFMKMGVKMTPYFVRHFAYIFWMRTKLRRSLRSTKVFCMFVGYPRSGHSLVAHLLNNHPNASIAHEFHVLDRLREFLYLHRWLGPRRNYQLLMANLMREICQQSKRPALISAGYHHSKFSKTNPVHKKLLVIGDKGAGHVSNIITTQGPAYIQHMAEYGYYALRLLHVVRNPFNMIATESIRTGTQYACKESDLEISNVTLSESLKLLKNACSPKKFEQLTTLVADKVIPLCFHRASVVQELKQSKLAPVLDVHYDQLIKEPHATLERILKFLGLTGDADHHKQCVAALSPESQSYRLYPELFSPERIAIIAKHMRQYEWFEGYTYES